MEFQKKLFHQSSVILSAFRFCKKPKHFLLRRICDIIIWWFI